MKKIIAISVMFVLLTGAAFAVDISGTVIGTVNLLEGNSAGGDVTSSGSMNRVRLEGSGGTDTFGGWIRAEGGFNGYAWWKPVEQLKLIIGGQPDGFWGLEGVTGWGFYQMISDTGVVEQGNVWGGAGRYGYGLTTRNAFYGGFDKEGLLIEITPADIASINIGIPFIEETGEDHPKAEDVFKHTTAQLALHLDFGTIGITYMGAPKYLSFGDGGTVFAYFGISAIENLGIDIGLGYQLDGEKTKKNPIAAGLGLKYATDSFGVKLRAVGAFAGEDELTRVLADLLPYFILSDSLRVGISLGLGMVMGDDTSLDWHFNPYLEVGGEWGPTFYAGIMAQSNGNGDNIGWSVPIAISVSF